jgi:HD-GYP domain-containing protein (c-di-GMP phosphodiesterase class II)
MKTDNLRDTVLIKIEDLRLGMFVIELDRPWNQTPFLLQGFLLINQNDYETLQLLVKELVIDPRLSNSSSYLHISWDRLHEEKNESEENSSTYPNAQALSFLSSSESKEKAIIENETATKKNEMLQFFVSVFSLNKKSISQLLEKNSIEKRAKSAMPYFLTYANQASYSINTSQQKEKTSLVKKSPPSTPQFTALIQNLYPRDALFAPLNWKEKWQLWQDRRNKKNYKLREKILYKQKTKKRRPAYIPTNIPLVTYSDQVTMKSELTHARLIIEKTDSLLGKINAEFQDSGVLQLEQIKPTIQLLSDSVIANPAALMWLLRMRSENTLVVSHALKVAVYMMTLGRHIGFSREQLIELGFIGLLLDVGKLEVPKEILQKSEKLSNEEKSIIQRHVQASLKLLKPADVLNENIEQGINQHHERMNGAGYPQGLIGEDISIFGKMAAIADSFTAMTSPRPYNVARSSFDAMKELFKSTETQFHTPLVEEFVQAIGIFPIGSMIELSNGVIAIVLEHNKIRRLEPKVLLLTKPNKKIIEKPIVLDLMEQNLFVENKRISILRGLPDGAYGLSYQDYYKSS